MKYALLHLTPLALTLFMFLGPEAAADSEPVHTGRGDDTAVAAATEKRLKPAVDGLAPAKEPPPIEEVPELAPRLWAKAQIEETVGGEPGHIRVAVTVTNGGGWPAINYELEQSVCSVPHVECSGSLGTQRVPITYLAPGDSTTYTLTYSLANRVPGAKLLAQMTIYNAAKHTHYTGIDWL